MTAAVISPSDMGTAAREALRAARIRGAILAALGLLALNVARESFDTPATFSFWIDRQGGTAFSIETSVGVLWLLAGVVAGALGIAQLVRGASFPWRRSLLLLIPIWIAAILADLLDGRAANMTGVIAGSLELAVPITLGAFAGILSERSGLLNIAHRGQVPHRGVRGVDRGQRHAERADRHLRGDRRGRPGRAAARVAGDPLQGRPDHLGRRRQHRCPGHHELPVPACPVPEHRAEHAADRRGDQDPAAGGHPDPRSDPVLRDAVPLRRRSS